MPAEAPTASTTGPTILRVRQVIARTGLPLSSLYQMVHDGEFPKPVPLARRSVGWVLSEVDSWIAQRIASREAEPRRQLRRRRAQ